MTMRSKGGFELFPKNLSSLITFPTLCSSKEHSDDAVMQEQEQAFSSKEHHDETVIKEQEQDYSSKEHSDDAAMQEEQEQVCSPKEHSDDAVMQEQALQLSREKQHYMRLTSFFKVDNSFLSPRNWDPSANANTNSDNTSISNVNTNPSDTNFDNGEQQLMKFQPGSFFSEEGPWTVKYSEFSSRKV